MLTGKLLITGGGGFLGRGIIRRIESEHWPVQIAILSRDSMKHAVLQKRYPQVRTILGDVAGMPEEHLAWLFDGYDYIVHAAATKYVDRSELAAWDTYRTNVLGSANVARAASRAGVRRAVAISTDKTVASVNTYGMTKAVMERLWQEAASWGLGTEYTAVRYGNVIGSTGSVLETFMRLVAEGVEIPLTDPLMTRFWMSIEEAVDCVLRALDPVTKNGELVVAAMRACSMTDVVRAVLGYNEHGPLPETGVKVVGVRPGEKRHEALIHKGESLRAYRKDGYYHLLPPGSPPLPGADAFEITSAHPPGGGIGVIELRERIADAATV